MILICQSLIFNEDHNNQTLIIPSGNHSVFGSILLNSLSIESGVKLSFNSINSKFVVYGGDVRIKGTDENPVIFSVNNSFEEYSINFDTKGKLVFL